MSTRRELLTRSSVPNTGLPFSLCFWQARTQQLLQQNRELLEHLASLGAYNEQQSAGLTSANIGMAPQVSSCSPFYLLLSYAIVNFALISSLSQLCVPFA